MTRCPICKDAEPLDPCHLCHALVCLGCWETAACCATAVPEPIYDATTAQDQAPVIARAGGPDTQAANAPRPASFATPGHLPQTPAPLAVPNPPDPELGRGGAHVAEVTR